MEKALGWAAENNMKVWIDLHGSPGSQNGFDNSGHQGDVDWQQGSNMATSLQVLEMMTKKYGTAQYANVVAGIEIVNEPISWGSNTLQKTQQFAIDAHDTLIPLATNENLNIVTHDGFETAADNWMSVPSQLNVSDSNKNFHIDTHLYQLYNDAFNAMNQDQHIQAACGWAADLAAANPTIPIFVGEWSANTNICIDGSGNTWAGNSCSTSGCQCTASSNFDDWSDLLKQETGKFIEAQLDTFEENASGYFLWAYKGPGGWGFDNLIEAGIFPNPVTSRKYPKQCAGSSSSKRGLRRRGVV